MKHLELFEEHSAKDVKNDSKYYKEFLKLNKEEISKMRDDYKELRWEALRNLNADINSKGHSGKIMSIDSADVELFPHLKGEKLKNFKKYSRILDFVDGYKPKNTKKVNEYHSDPNVVAYYKYEEEVVDELEDELLDKLIDKYAIIIKSAFELGKDAKQCVKDIIQKIKIGDEN